MSVRGGRCAVCGEPLPVAKGLAGACPSCGEPLVAPAAVFDGNHVIGISFFGSLVEFDPRHPEAKQQRAMKGGCWTYGLDPSRPRLASWWVEGSVTIQDRAKAAELYRCQDLSDVMESVEFSADGSLVAAAARNGEIAVWSVPR